MSERDPFEDAPHEDPVPRMIVVIYVMFGAVFVLGVVIGFVVGRLT